MIMSVTSLYNCMGVDISLMVHSGGRSYHHEAACSRTKPQK